MEQLEGLEVTKLVTIAERKRGNKMNIKTTIAVRLLSFLWVSILFLPHYASENGYSRSISRENIVLQAEISNQKLEKNSQEDFYRLILPMRLSLINDQEKPLLLIRETIQIVGVRIATTESNLQKKIYMHDSSFLPSFKQGKVKKLTYPTSDVVEIVFPKERYDWDENYWIGLKKRKSNSSSSPSLSLEDLRVSDALIDSVWIEFDVAFFPMNSMRGEGEELKANWKESGTLLLETVTTLPIEMSLPKSNNLKIEGH